MQKKRLVVATVIIFQISIISVLLYNLIRIHTTVHIAPINKNSIVFTQNTPLKHFYEPKENTTITDPPAYFSLPYTPTYTINNDNLNERYNYTMMKDKDTIRIITLGDSYTFGHYVNTSDNWSEKLEDMLNTECEKFKEYEVINLGERGYDISYAVERFKKRGIKYDPDIVIWFVKPDDFNAINDIVYPTLRKYRNEMEKNNSLLHSINEGNYYPHSKKARQEFIDKYTLPQIFDIQHRFLQEFTSVYKNQLIFISFNLNNQEIQLLKNFAAQRFQTYMYSNLPAFNRLPDNHPSKNGHISIALHVFNYLHSEKINICTAAQ